ncbi:hypothetical protein CPC08DRAFT_771087 [Agrocybe pediades]|nr:hypothetical protein CPC08DRAFT_771087 [Agrocybe pediades]
MFGTNAATALILFNGLYPASAQCARVVVGVAISASSASRTRVSCCIFSEWDSRAAVQRVEDGWAEASLAKPPGPRIAGDNIKLSNPTKDDVDAVAGVGAGGPVGVGVEDDEKEGEAEGYEDENSGRHGRGRDGVCRASTAVEAEVVDVKRRRTRYDRRRRREWDDRDVEIGRSSFGLILEELDDDVEDT